MAAAAARSSIHVLYTHTHNNTHVTTEHECAYSAAAAAPVYTATYRKLIDSVAAAAPISPDGEFSTVSS